MTAELWPETTRQLPLLGIVFEGWDGGAQQPLSRAVLRLLCLAVLLIGLALPARPGWRRPRWFLPGQLFLLLGLVSALRAEHRFEALREWENWLLAGLLVYVVASGWRPRWRGFLLVSCYLLTGLLLVHSMLLGFPAAQRLGGPLNHPNAFSALALMLLPVLLARAFSRRCDAALGQACCGVLLGLTLSTGSLTGAALLTFLAWAGALRRTRPAARWSAAAFCGLLVIVANPVGGWLAMLAAPLLLAAAWLWLLAAGVGRDWLFRGAAIALVAGLILLAQVALAPMQGQAASQVSRAASLRGRWEFYRCALRLSVRQPLFGVGPGGFSRHYPSEQRSPAYFSRYPHSWPLEVAGEWGLPALLALGTTLMLLLREPPADPTRRCAGWVLAMFVLHASTDVQTGFFYLLLLAALALGVLGSGEPSSPCGPEGPACRWTRTALAVGCLGLLVLAVHQAEAAFDRTLAAGLARRVRGVEGKGMVEDWLAAAQAADPLDSEIARLWGLSLLAGGKPELAAAAARLARELDPRRAACLYLALSCEPPARGESERAYREAIGLDRINYPTFYRWLAEALAVEGRYDEALDTLRQQGRHYTPLELDALFDFRREELSDQLVEYHALQATLEERAAGGAGGPELALALQRCQRLEYRRRRLLVYLGGLASGPLAAEARVLLDQIPAQDVPAAVEPASDRAQRLQLP